METNWAVEHLQVIRTLMERSAVYRRALAPVMVLTGVIGILAALAGWLAQIKSPEAFAIYWLAVSLVAVLCALLLVRRQAFKEGEPFWSPPTRRVTQALLPPLAGGFILSVIFLFQPASNSPHFEQATELAGLPAVWVILYGCGLHAAGFFMPRGVKLFGWVFVLCGCGLLTLGVPSWPRPLDYAEGVMGLFFGALHLGYGTYLYFTEQGKNAA